MKIIEPDVKEIIQDSGLEGIYKQIATAGRICYASDKTDNNKEFVDRLINLKHGRPLEFGTVYLKINLPVQNSDIINDLNILMSNHWTKYRKVEDCLYITTNYRVLVENDLLYFIDKFLSSPTEHHYKRRTFHWTISRGIADEFRTHISLSSLMQSTRYCAYDKDKFGNELTIIKPQWIHTTDYHSMNKSEKIWVKSVTDSEMNYMLLRKEGVSAENARGSLCLDIKTEFIQCGFESDWNQFLDQRLYGKTGKPHPDAKAISEKLALCLQNQN